MIRLVSPGDHVKFLIARVRNRITLKTPAFLNELAQLIDGLVKLSWQRRRHPRGPESDRGPAEE